MAVIVVGIHHVPNFDRFKRAFDRGMARHRGDGVLSHRLYRATDDANEVLVAFEIDTVEHAEAFLAKTDQAWLERAGMDVYPPMFLGEPIEIVEYDASSGQ
jgi:hypothetical protein